MKALKIVGIVLAVVVVLVGGALAYVASQFDAPRIKAEIAKAVYEKKQRTLKIDGDVKLGFWPDVAVSLGKVSLSEHKSDKEFAAIDAARVSVAVMPLLSKQVVVNTVEITGARASVVKHKDGTLNIADLMSPDKSDSQPVQLDIASVKIANAQFTWRDEQASSATTISGLDLTTGRVQADTGKKTFGVDNLALAVKGKSESQAGADTFDVKIAAPRLAVTPDKSGGDSVVVSATLSGPQRNVAAKVTLAGVEGSAQAFKIARIGIDVDAKAADAAVKGKLDSALTVDLEKKLLAADKIAGAFDIAHPQMPMKQVKLPIEGAVHADLVKSSAAGRLATQFDESKIALKFDLARFAPLSLGFDLDIDKLNLDKYLPPEKEGAKKPAGDGKLDFSALKGLDVHGSVKIGSLQVANVKASNIRLQIKAAGGRLDVAPLSANLYEGSLSGALSVDANGNAVTVKQNLAGIAIQPLLKDFADKDMLDGRGNVALDIATHGDTVAAMKKSLAGSASLSLKDGAVKGINLAQSLRDLKAKFSSKQDTVQQAKATDKTDFSELSASFKIVAGVAHNDDLSAKSPFFRLGGNGDIDIGAGQLNYLAKASIVASSGGQGGKDLDHLKGLTVPVRLTGPFDNPSWKIEFAGLATEAVKAKVEEKTQAVKQQAQDQVKNKLKGLFGK